VGRKEDPLDRMSEHLPRSKDLTLIVLKGHLLVEEQINKLLDVLLKNPKAVAGARLTFYQRLCILKALLPQAETTHSEWQAIEKLNSLRNQFAHTLEPACVEKRVKEFLAMIEDPDVPEEEWNKEHIETRLKRCIAAIFGIVSGFRQGITTVKKKSTLK
jgi:hypothetical protein